MISACPIVSIVIPAHNEERDIHRTLTRLLQDAEEGEFDIVVVPNACSDDTARVAESVPGVRVVETAKPGKARAIQLGYDACAVYPRLFVDADVSLSTDSVRKLLVCLSSATGILACAPQVKWDLSECGPIARRAHLAHEALLEGRRVLAGVGAYVLSQQACNRVFPFPDVIADDEYIHRSFDYNERMVVSGAVSVTRPAPSFRTLVRRRARVRSGNQQLIDLKYPGPQEQPLRLRDLISAIVRHRVRPLHGSCFLCVAIAERLLVAFWRVRRTNVTWSVERWAGVR